MKKVSETGPWSLISSAMACGMLSRVSSPQQILTGDPLHSRAACTQPCNVNTHSRAHCSRGARLCEQWVHGCVNNGCTAVWTMGHGCVQVPGCVEGHPWYWLIVNWIVIEHKHQWKWNQNTIIAVQINALENIFKCERNDRLVFHFITNCMKEKRKWSKIMYSLLRKANFRL